MEKKERKTRGGPSYTMMFLLLAVLLGLIAVMALQYFDMKGQYQQAQADLTQIKSALTSLEEYAKSETNAQEGAPLKIELVYPSALNSDAENLGDTIAIVQEANAHALDTINSYLVIFSIFAAIFVIAVPLLNYGFFQKDQIKRLDDQFEALKVQFKEDLERLRKSVEQATGVNINLSSGTGQDGMKMDVKPVEPISQSNKDQAAAFAINANLYYQKRQYVLALKEIDKAIALEPENADYYRRRGAVLHAMKRYDEALKFKNKAIALEPDNASYYDSRGATLHGMGRYCEALIDYNRAIALDPNNASYYNSRGITLHALKRYDEALQDAEKAKVLDPLDEEYITSVAYSLYANRRYDEALGYCTDLGDRVDSSVYLALRTRAMATLKRALIERGEVTAVERERVLRDLEGAIHLFPGNEHSFIQQAEALLLLKEYAAAHESLQKALALDSDEPETYHWLAEYYRAVGDEKNANVNDQLANDKGYIPEPE